MLDQAGSELVCSCLVWIVFQKKETVVKKVTVTKKKVTVREGTHQPGSESGFTKPTGPVKPPLSGSGLLDRFDRKPVETG